jgi:hypothetical protein
MFDGPIHRGPLGGGSAVAETPRRRAAMRRTFG